MSLQLQRRILTAVLLIPPLFFVIYQGGPLLTIAVLVAALIAYWEIGHACRNIGDAPSLPVGLAMTAALVLTAAFSIESIGGILLAGILTSIFWVAWSRTEVSSPHAIIKWALTIAAVAYVGGVFRYVVLLRGLPNGLAWTAITIIGTWTCDTGAYVAGKLLGRRPMAPALSPKKTWEGAIGGVILSFAAIAALGATMNLAPIHVIALGVLIPLATECGDLTASMIKRSTGVKDFSNLLPGHGGMLDRVDGLIFAALATYYYVLWFAG